MCLFLAWGDCLVDDTSRGMGRDPHEAGTIEIDHKRRPAFARPVDTHARTELSTTRVATQTCSPF